VNWDAGTNKLTAVGQNGATGTRATDAFALTVGNYELASASGGGQVRWSGQTAPTSLADITGLPNVEALNKSAFVNATAQFVATGANQSGGLELVTVNHVYNVTNSKTNIGFTPRGLGNDDIIVGSNSAASVAEVWGPGIGLRTLASLSSNTKGFSLNNAMAIDGSGNIYGVGFKGPNKIYFEAVKKLPQPSVRITTPKNGKSYRKGASLHASYQCKAAAGFVLRSCKGTVAKHHRISTAKVGKHVFRVTARDSDGGTRTVTAHYRVVRA
jgi:hypothetical protein